MTEVSEEKSVNNEERINLDEVKNEHSTIINHQKVYQTKNGDQEEGVTKFFRYRSKKLKHAKLPNFKISRGLLGTFIFCVLFCSLLIWFIRDFEGIT